MTIGHSNSNEKSCSLTKVFSDSGASICLGGANHLEILKVTKDQLIPCSKNVSVVGGSTIPCIGWVPAVFNVGGVDTSQPLYICDYVDRIFLSKKACIETFILPPTFPKPTPSLQQLAPVSDSSSANSLPPHQRQPKKDYVAQIAPEASTESSQIKKSRKRTPPPRPTKIPYPPVESNVPKLRQYIVEKFKDSAFDRSAPFPKMNTKQGHIYLKPDAVPHAVYSPIPVPHHEKERVKALLDQYVERGIIAPVPLGTPVVWCAAMVLGKIKMDPPG